MDKKIQVKKKITQIKKSGFFTSKLLFLLSKYQCSISGLSIIDILAILKGLFSIEMLYPKKTIEIGIFDVEQPEE